MNIRRIQLHHFGCHAHLDLAFAPGLNVVKGPNGAGKSTLQRALLQLLFGTFTSTKSNEVDRAWGASQLYRLLLEMEVDGLGIVSLRKDFDEKSCSLCQPGEQELTRPTAVHARVAEFIGTTSDKLFKSTLFVAQNELSPLDTKTDKEISTVIEARVTGGDGGTSTQGVLANLEKKISAIKKGYGRSAPIANPGPLRKLQTELAQLDGLIADLTKKLSTHRQIQSDRDALAEEQHEIQEELTSTRADLAYLAKIDRLRQEQTAAAAREHELEALVEKIDQAQRHVTAARQQLTTLGAVAQVDTDTHKALSQQYSTCQALKSQPLPSSTSPVQSPSSFPIGAIALLILGIILLAGGIYLFLAPNLLWAVMASALGALLLAAGGTWLIVHLIAARRTVAHAKAGAADAQQLIARLQRNLYTAESELATALTTLGCSDWSDYERKFELARQTRRQLESAQAALDALLPNGGSRGTLDDERRQASRTRRDKEESLAEPALQPYLHLPAFEQQKYQRRIDELQGKLATAQRKYSELTGHLQAMSVSPTDLIVAEERRAAKAQEFARGQELLAVYERTHALLQTARQKVVEQMPLALSSSASRHFHALTLGRYDAVMLDPELNLTVHVPPPVDRQISPSDLSCGTRDQLYMAVRLALVDHLLVDSRAPLFLDDPFITFDPMRRAAALDLCCKIAKLRQVFLFTCADDYDDHAHVIALPMPSLAQPAPAVAF